MSRPSNEQITLGDKLKPPSTRARTLGKSIVALVVSSLLAMMVWWALKSPVSGFGVLILCLVVFGILLSKENQSIHPLLYADKHRFMSSLKLADKTAIFDGHNIYHLGLNHQLGPKPLASLVRGLRADGYRIVCFFDANIYFTLIEHGDLKKSRARYTSWMIERIFGLDFLEIYVVPNRFQADVFILESLANLPKSFAVTNDKFRDYQEKYDFLTTQQGWRKGVKIVDGQVVLNGYTFKTPLT